MKPVISLHLDEEESRIRKIDCLRYNIQRAKSDIAQLEAQLASLPEQIARANERLARRTAELEEMG